MAIRIIAFTSKGCHLAARLESSLSDTGVDCIAERKGADSPTEYLPKINGSLKEWVGKRFDAGDDLIFIGATGIAVRSISPYLKDKTKDPAVLVIDEGGRFIIPLISGHIGGANDLAAKVSELIGGIQVITTATDINSVFAVDVFAKDNDLIIEDMTLAKEVSAALLSGGMVCFNSDLPFSGKLPSQLELCNEGELGISITRTGSPKPYLKTLFLRPRPYCVGIGCRRGTSAEVIEKALFKVLDRNGIALAEVHSIASIDLKADEQGIIDFTNQYGIPFKTFSKDELLSVDDKGLEESGFVKSVTGVGNVSQRAALLVADGPVVQPKAVVDGVTVSIAVRRQNLFFRSFGVDDYE